MFASSVPGPEGPDVRRRRWLIGGGVLVALPAVLRRVLSLTVSAGVGLGGTGRSGWSCGARRALDRRPDDGRPLPGPGTGDLRDGVGGRPGLAPASCRISGRPIARSANARSPPRCWLGTVGQRPMARSVDRADRSRCGKVSRRRTRPSRGSASTGEVGVESRLRERPRREPRAVDGVVGPASTCSPTSARARRAPTPRSRRPTGRVRCRSLRQVGRPLLRVHREIGGHRAARLGVRRIEQGRRRCGELVDLAEVIAQRSELVEHVAAQRGELLRRPGRPRPPAGGIPRRPAGPARRSARSPPAPGARPRRSRRRSAAWRRRPRSPRARSAAGAPRPAGR